MLRNCRGIGGNSAYDEHYNPSGYCSQRPYIGLGACEKVSGLTTDGASTMSGTRVGVVTKLTDHAKKQVVVGMDEVSTAEYY